MAISVFPVLLVSENAREAELYRELINDLVPCQMDIISHFDNLTEKIKPRHYGLLILDELMSTLEVIERTRRLSPTTHVIVLTNNATVEDAVDAIRLGADDYLQKPVDLERFQLAVKRGIDRDRVFGEDKVVNSYLQLIDACKMISASLEEVKVFRIIRSFLMRVLNSSHAGIYRLENGALEPVSLDEPQIGGPPSPEHKSKIIEVGFNKNEPPLSDCLEMSKKKEISLFTSFGQKATELFVFRFQGLDGREYFCLCFSPLRPPVTEMWLSQVQMLGAQIEVTIKNITRYMGVQHLVYLDDATGLYNTRYLNYILDREIALYKSSGNSFALLFIDADGFKGINDTHGHLVGTKLLNELGGQIRKFVRETDTVFRYGGDEFIAVLSPCDLLTAKSVAERIRAAVEKKFFLARENLNIHFTVSIGVSLFPDHADSKKTIIESADHAMYTAKRSNRNCVMVQGKK